MSEMTNVTRTQMKQWKSAKNQAKKAGEKQDNKQGNKQAKDTVAVATTSDS